GGDPTTLRAAARPPGSAPRRGTAGGLSTVAPGTATTASAAAARVRGRLAAAHPAARASELRPGAVRCGRLTVAAPARVHAAAVQATEHAPARRPRRHLWRLDRRGGDRSALRRLRQRRRATGRCAECTAR